ncbi:MAG: hypothetical protein HOC63_05115 [Rhodospirillales bacterium]|jgi:hypothetical protein|nr:hypothetical protein [Rhodospirillales bacterium]MBT4041122.1 hypothetical protein [Rhodospirillales bacterium]MBT4626052.1 hypothetical protein [Rhodospirillales bacterium]MBT5350730.1 hypothetical protein [Rhodospirillales bacterium]MBT5519311.1 hypothetical protein [Rhodospirillales bacterium]
MNGLVGRYAADTNAKILDAGCGTGNMSQLMHDVGDKFTELENAGAWTLEEKTEPFRTYPFSKQYADLRHWVCVYRKSR